MTVQYIMLVTLGFLLASLITLLLAPIFWHRAVRLTSSRLRQSLPLTEQEILADKDQLRAKYAIRVHQLEKQVEHASLGGARQKIDLNRRDANIGQLETEIIRLKSEIEESHNARFVLEQTVGDRIPKIETKLDEARKLLLVRDREVAELSQSSRRHQEALNEARVINEKQTSDIERLRAQAKAYEAQSRKGKGGRDAAGELALQTELEMLRGRTRDQVSVIERLNAEVAANRSAAASTSTSAQVVALNGSGRAAAADAQGGARSANAPENADALATARRQVALLEKQLESAKAGRPDAKPEAESERALRVAKAQLEDKATEIVRLRTELAAVTAAATVDDASPSLRENRIALKAQITGLEAQSAQQNEIIQRLRTELAQANERAARQSASFVDEMRRLGVAAHVTQPRTGRTPVSDDHARPAGVAKRTQAILEASGSGSDVAGEGNGPVEVAQVASLTPVSGVGRLLMAANRSDATASSVPTAKGPTAIVGSSSAPSPMPARVSNLVAALRSENGAGQVSPGTQPKQERAVGESVSASSSDQNAPAQPRQARLLDRITAADAKS